MINNTQTACQMSKEIDTQRDKEIQELIKLLEDNKVHPEWIVRRIVYLTGLCQDYIAANFMIHNILEHEILIIDISYDSLSQRNATICEIIEMYLAKGYRAGAAEIKLSYLTGLSIRYIQQVRWNNKIPKS